MDGKLRACGDEWGLVRIWDAASRKEIAILDWHMEMITCLVFSRDGRILAAACRDGTIKLWDALARNAP
jgi:WD40 repeat protein